MQNAKILSATIPSDTEYRSSDFLPASSDQIKLILETDSS